MVRPLGSLIRCTLIAAVVALLGLGSGCASMRTNSEHVKLESRIERDKRKAELYQKAEAAYQNRDIETAKNTFESLVAEFPDLFLAHYRLGNIAFIHQDLERAGEYFREAVRIKPRDPKAHYNLAMVRLLEAERHLKFYTATVDPETDVNAISIFLGAIDRFSNSLDSKQEKEDSLDSIVSTIDKRQ